MFMEELSAQGCIFEKRDNAHRTQDPDFGKQFSIFWFWLNKDLHSACSYDNDPLSSKFMDRGQLDLKDDSLKKWSKVNVVDTIKTDVLNFSQDNHLLLSLIYLSAI